MENIVLIMYCISLLSIIFGFVALLTQKIYRIDSDGKQEAEEIEVPLFGKLKSNYPALIFVFLGFSLAFVTFEKSFPPQKVEWKIMGSFKDRDNTTVDWTKGTITLFPSFMTYRISERGKFDITVNIDEGKTFEDFFELLDFSHPDASIQIEPEKEYKAYRDGKETLIESVTKNTRKFKPLPVTFYNK